jgi:hypothetical protein
MDLDALKQPQTAVSIRAASLVILATGEGWRHAMHCAVDRRLRPNPLNLPIPPRTIPLVPEPGRSLRTRPRGRSERQRAMLIVGRFIVAITARYGLEVRWLHAGPASLRWSRLWTQPVRSTGVTPTLPEPRLLTSTTSGSRPLSRWREGPSAPMLLSSIGSGTSAGFGAEHRLLSNSTSPAHLSSDGFPATITRAVPRAPIYAGHQRFGMVS